MSDQTDKEWLAAEYAMGTLRGAEKTAFEKMMTSDLALQQSVRVWSDRLCSFDTQQPLSFGGLSEDQIDAALDSMLRSVSQAIDASLVQQGGPALENPFLRLNAAQKAAARPAVVRLLASYVVLLERLKAQQRMQSMSFASAPVSR